jgi:hypothetical protein
LLLLLFGAGCWRRHGRWFREHARLGRCGWQLRFLQGRVVAIEDGEACNGHGDQNESDRQTAHRTPLQPLLVLYDLGLCHVFPGAKQYHRLRAAENMQSTLRVSIVRRCSVSSGERTPERRSSEVLFSFPLAVCYPDELT